MALEFADASIVRQERKVVRLADYQRRKLAEERAVENSVEDWAVAKSPTPQPSYPQDLAEPPEDVRSSVIPNSMLPRRETSRKPPILQSGVLAYRSTKDGEPLVDRSKWGVVSHRVV
jgi:hypothetical protein